jgi:hypothetical protein
VIEVEADLIMALASLIVLAALVAVVWGMGVAAADGRHLERQQSARPAIRPAPRRNVIQVKPTEIKVIDR